MDHNSDPNYQDLVSVMKCTPRPLALLGAGVSVDSGYPTWNRLLEMLEAKVPEISPKYKEFLRKLDDPAWTAEEYRRLMGEHTFQGLIASVFGPKERKRSLLRTISRLRFRHLLTTNYDPSIELAFVDEALPLRVVDWTEEANMKRFFADLYRDGDNPYLVYLHGRYYDPTNIVLTESSYAKRYVRSDETQRKLFAIMITQPLVLIGFSVTDPDLNHLMREVNVRLGGGTHFAFMGYEFNDQHQFIRSRLERKYGIRPVFYRIARNADGSENHDGLIGLIRQLYQDVFEEEMRSPLSSPSIIGVKVRSAPDAGSEIPPSKLPLDPLDIQKGQWGRTSENKERKLSVANIECEEDQSFCYFDLVVESVEGASSQLEGRVRFHLHQTFDRMMREVTATDGKAILNRLCAYGAFTVGVEADNGQTLLELDLSQVTGFPQWFKDR